ncbi:uncharacterized protein HMPREF1541_09757 [Cyphellophora europaea CBS 101466]|uniref:RING-type domain-containing protein n=1 Tax=Cyphellophora europaea (strain CBS 101466) TaxID=1220924 RepID=W2S8A1_CYPE1|nr:uncharacterized protein HMPREF1541_09757 [Cyphellophora europaea CBS 101466]ETN44882.1 hypothetical protein HMPREF1541_09757 [Cyphellophora europaea CBS 101466]
MEIPSSAVLSATATPTAFLSSSSSWSNVTAYALNISSSYLNLSSAGDFAKLPFRIARDLDNAVFRTLPRYLLEATGLISVAAANDNIAAPAANVAGEAAAHAGAEAAVSWSDIISEAFQASTFKSYWGVMQYVTSRWAFTCFVVALILNRVSVYGASRQRIFLSWNKRLALRLVPIMLFIPQIYQLLSAIRCQTSPDYSLYRHGDNNKYSTLDWSTDGGTLYSLTSKGLYWQTDAQACAAVGMSRPEPDVRAPYGSFSLLWPTFLRLALSHMVESLSCSLQQIPLMTEVGMSVFEHSLAFAEAESMITSTLTMLAKQARAASKTTATVSATSTPSSTGLVMASGTVMALSDAVSSLMSPHILDRINVPVEVLLVALLSASNALCSNILAVLGKQHRWRLVNTAFWGCMFMGSFVWGFATNSIMSRADEGDSRPVSSLLHFPTVAIVGFLPHMLILLGILVCLAIYSIALTLTALSLGTNPSIPQPSSLKERFIIAHDNLTAAIQLRGIQLRWAEDFYTALLRIGFTALTAASEAVFLNEGRSVEMRQFTWLEEERLDELQLSRDRQSAVPTFQIVEEYGVPSSSPGGSDQGGVWESGYSKERKFDKKEGELSGKDSFAYPTPRQDGVGAFQRTTRFYLLLIYIRGIMFLMAGWIAFGIGVTLDKVGITSRPRWLRRIVGRSLKGASRERDRMNSDLLHGNAGRGDAPDNPALDIETEMRRNIQRDHEGEEAEKVLDEHIYQWWKDGGWFGMQDKSGEYQPSTIDEDATSILSMSTAASTNDDAFDDDWEDEPEGARTPTQMVHGPSRQTWSFSAVDVRSRESTPSESVDTPLDPATLARLLDPRDADAREEARILASHLSTSTDHGSAGRIMTRSRYRMQAERERARVLLAGRRTTDKRTAARTPAVPLFTPSPMTSRPRPLTPDEEAQALEALLLKHRNTKSPFSLSASRNEVRDEADNDGAGSGLLCVVCQTSSRTIIAWPCRCLCVCEDCRVSLAMNNFGNCVTCRRNVGGFVRLYVP